MKKSLFISLLLVLTTMSFAFDGEQKGFILGLGLGGSTYEFVQVIQDAYTSIESDPETGVGLATDFLIGYAPDNRFAIYYSNKVTWLTIENMNSDEIFISSGITGIGLAYHFMKPDAWSPNFFINASAGWSSWDSPNDLDSKTWYGGGGSFGFGYEFAKHYSIQGNLKASAPDITESGITATTIFVGFDIIFAALAY